MDHNKRMELYSLVWQDRLALVAMKLTQQGRECTKMKKEAGVESGACGQNKLENNEPCRSSGAGEELVRRATTSSVLYLSAKTKAPGP